MTYDAYAIVDANSPDKPDGFIWWDGKHTRASSDAILGKLKKLMIPVGQGGDQGSTTTLGDGKTFFDQLPLAYRSGYTYLKKIKVDEDGKPV
jgi:hypothetical protein